ncbi:MAG: asparagine synthase (glutamine-hydrolyzing) [Chloroflexi bacterium HGW-Chloroflexi-1]|nr:MAG: asparagine synthase (glutamine-hydrolyzing) [Chloroflexi bacterium HGW-Chloroflexi-1]
MCGIAGLIKLNAARLDAAHLSAMADAIRHRGPDDIGYILGNVATGDYAIFGGDDTPADVFGYPLPYAPAGRLTPGAFGAGEYTLGLANRRLAIVDLAPTGHQPMCNEDRSVWIVYNGELYNAEDLRAELAALGHRFVSHSDTEVILHAYEAWDQACPARFNGMWAFAIWDIPRRRLMLSRDRAGIKPLYLWQDANRFAFASEIKALLAVDIPRRANPTAIYDFLAANLSDHTAETFFEGIRALPAAHTWTLDLTSGTAQTRRYWQLDPARQIRLPSDAAYANAFRELFEDAVRRHLISDVPVGTCLSGGLDSSAVVCVINALIRQRGLHVVGMESRQKTFSARYDDSRHDEGRFIETVVADAAVDGRMIYPTPADLGESWQDLVYHLEEPFGSTSIFAQWNVFKLARQSGVKVTLDGQGGDELLAGYLGFFPFYFADLAASLRWPRLIAEFRGHCALHRANPRGEARNILSNLLPERLRLDLKNRALAQQPWLAPDFAASQAAAAGRWRTESAVGSRLSRGLYRALAFDPLPSLLRFDDRNSMAHSIESRVPFLDYRLIEFCFALPSAQKIRDGATKHILRQAMRGTIPESVRTRHDKIGFSTPQDTWLRGELAPWLREVFTSPEFRGRPYWSPEAVLGLLDRHVGGAGDYSSVLWRCLVTELWRRAFET